MKLLGNAYQLTPLPDEYDWDSRNGARVVKRWQGTLNNCLVYATALQAPGVSTRITPVGDGATYVLEFRPGDAQDGTEEVVDTWELDVIDLEKRIWENQNLVDAIDGFLGEGTLDYIRYYWEHPDKRGTETSGAIVTTFDETFSSDDPIDVLISASADCRQLWEDLLHGTEAFNVDRFVLKHTQTVSGTYSGQADIANVGRLFTTSGMTSAESIPGTILFQLPASGWWLKKRPRVSQISNGKFQISQEYWHADDYSPLLYTPA